MKVYVVTERYINGNHRVLGVYKDEGNAKNRAIDECLSELGAISYLTNGRGVYWSNGGYRESTYQVDEATVEDVEDRNV